MTWDDWLNSINCKIRPGYDPSSIYFRRWFYYTYQNKVPTYAEVLKDLSKQYTTDDVACIVKPIIPDRSDLWGAIRDPDIPISTRLHLIGIVHYKEKSVTGIIQDRSLPDPLRRKAVDYLPSTSKDRLDLLTDASESEAVRYDAILSCSNDPMVHKKLEVIFSDASCPIRIREEAVRFASYVNNPELLDSSYMERVKSMALDPSLDPGLRYQFLRVVKLRHTSGTSLTKEIILDTSQPEQLRRRAIHLIKAGDPLLINILGDPSQPEWLKMEILSHIGGISSDTRLGIIMDKNQSEALRIQAIRYHDTFLMDLLLDPSESTSIRVAATTKEPENPDERSISLLKNLIEDPGQPEKLRLEVLILLVISTHFSNYSIWDQINILMDDSYPKSLKLWTIFSVTSRFLIECQPPLNLLTYRHETTPDEIKKVAIMLYAHSSFGSYHCRRYYRYCDHIGGNLVTPVSGTVPDIRQESAP